MKEQVLQSANDLHQELIDIRRHLHENPELSFKEFETSEFIKSKLTEWGIEYKDGWVKTGIVAQVSGNNENGNCVAIRADMDALPITEIEDRKYRSKNENIMHACGHDVHTTCVLGALKILQDHASNWSGTVKAIFQPGEEKLPGGASLMIEEGLIEFLKADAVIGQHVHPPLEVGKVGFHAGSYMASADEIYIRIKGKGGHAALPDNVVSPLKVAADLIIGFGELEEKHNEPTNPIVLALGKINSLGGATNVIPSEISMEGTFRAMDENKRYEMHSLMHQLVENLETKWKATIELNIMIGYPSLYNDPVVTQKLVEFANDLLGQDKVVQLPKRMTSEDFSFYTQSMPGCFYRLGTGNIAKGITSPVHTPNFDVDEDCLKTGSAMMAFAAINYLQS